MLRCLLLDVALAVHGLMYIVGCCVGCAWSDVCQVAEFAGGMCSDVCHVAECAKCTCSDVCCVPCSMGIETRHAWGMTETSPIGTSGCLKVYSSAFALHNSTCIMV